MPTNKGYLTAKTDKASDEVYTPEYAVKPILKYIKPNQVIWCPFDKKRQRICKIYYQLLDNDLVYGGRNLLLLTR